MPTIGRVAAGRLGLAVSCQAALTLNRHRTVLSHQNAQDYRKAAPVPVLPVAFHQGDEPADIKVRSLVAEVDYAERRYA